MGTKKVSTYREVPKVMARKPFKLRTREERAESQAILQQRLEVAEEASRLMNTMGISSKVTQVPEWMLGMAAYSIKVGIRYMPNLGHVRAQYPHFMEALEAGWKGDMTTVEMFFLSNED